jgi:hypothetical protein
MLRRISTIIAAAAMLVLAALPVSAATMSSSASAKHTLSFPGLKGIDAWGSYTRTGSKVKASVCVGVAAHGVFAAGAVALSSNANNSKSQKFGAVAIGYHAASCVTENLKYTNHLHIYTFIGGSNGKIKSQTKSKAIY